MQSGIFGTTGNGADNGRRHARVSFDLMARLRHGVTRTTVVLKDMTTHGARVEGLGRMRIDETVTLYLPGLAPKLAFVAWSDAHSAGLEFERPLHGDVFREMVREHAIHDGHAAARKVA